MLTPRQLSISGIRDNRARGSVGDYLKAKIKPDAELSIVSAYFTIFAYDALRTQLESASHLRFLFGEPSFINALDPTKTDKKAFQIEDTGLVLANRLQQKAVARECADWIRRKVEIRSIAKANLLHGKLYHIDNHGVSEAILGSSNFTVSGLGLSANSNIELNLEVDSRRDREDLKAWFDELWNEPTVVADVKAEVLAYLEQLYQNHAPQFIYYKTLYHVFENLLGDRVIGDDQLHRTSLLESKIWKSLYTFQRDGAKSATFEDNPLANQDLEELIVADLKYRDKQLLRMREEVLDLEDLSRTMLAWRFPARGRRRERPPCGRNSRAGGFSAAGRPRPRGVS